MELTQRVKYLEAKTLTVKSCLRREVKALKTSFIAKPAKSIDVTISGIPNVVNDSPEQIADRVFSAFCVSDVSDEINNVRMFTYDFIMHTDCTGSTSSDLSSSSNCEPSVCKKSINS